MERVENIRNLLLVSFKMSHKNATGIGNQIVAVDHGYKVGFIWDIGPPIQMQQIEQIMEQLRASNLLTSEILVVGIADDVCVLNKTNFLQSHVDYTFIDVRSTLETPKVLKSNEHGIDSMVEDVKKQIEMAKNSIVLQVNKDAYCIPTLIGFLVGFPILYWYDPSDKHANCLGNIDLNVFKLFRNDVLITSFSCPETLQKDAVVQQSLKQWSKKYNDCRIEITTCKSSSIVNL